MPAEATEAAEAEAGLEGGRTEEAELWFLLLLCKGKGL